jgi:hypothetical protein
VLSDRTTLFDHRLFRPVTQKIFNKYRVFEAGVPTDCPPSAVDGNEARPSRVNSLSFAWRPDALAVQPMSVAADIVLSLGCPDVNAC